MEKMYHLITGGGSAAAIGLGGIVTLLFGSWLPLMTALLIVQAIDIITGVLVGGKEDELGSRAFFLGIKRKVAMWMLIILAHIIDDIAFAGLPVAVTGVISFLLAGEGLSIVENLSNLGVPVPKFIKNHLQKMKEQADKEEIGQDIDKK